MLGTMRAELLRGSADNPDDVASWLAYADWLQQEDTPRGELIALDIALETAADKTELEARRAELLVARAPALLGTTFSKFIAEGYGTIAWRRGFIDRLSYDGKALAHKRAVGWLVRVICEEYPEPFTFMRRLALPGTDLASVTPLARFERLVELDISDSNVTDLAPLAAFGELRKVDVRGCGIRTSYIAELGLARPDLAVRS
jgi:uncharacterized protein (TIGR02996 family)